CDRQKKTPPTDRRRPIGWRSIRRASGRTLRTIGHGLRATIHSRPGARDAGIRRSSIVGTFMSETGPLVVDDRSSARSRLIGLSLSCPSATMTPFAADRRHVSTIAADGFPALPTRDARFVRRKFMSGPLGVRRLTTLTRNLTLFGRVHRRK